jgi:conjugal transfer pilus assembly protein TraF
LVVSALALAVAMTPVFVMAQDRSDAPNPYQSPLQSDPSSFPEIERLLKGTSNAPGETPAPTTEQTHSAAQQKQGGGSSAYCDARLGTWFYCEDPDEEEETQASSDGRQPSSPQQDEKDVAAAKQFKDQMERARQIAVWNPTEANLRRYYAYQQVTMEKSGFFADAIRRIVWADPSLDYNQQRPIGEAAKTDWLQARTTDRDLFFRGAYDKIGLFYIYRGSCAPCRSASPIVASFGKRYGFPIQAISTDGAPNPDFPEYKVDKGQLAAWGITNPVTPAYLIYQKPTLAPNGDEADVTITVTDGKRIKLRPCLNPKGCVTYLGAGVLTMDDMADRLFVTLATDTGKDF